MKPWMRLAMAGLALGWLAGCATAPSRDGGAQSPEEARQVRAVLQRWLEASGGRDALRHLVSLDEQMTLSNAEGGAELELHYLRMSSGPYRFELQSPAFGQIVEAFDGRTAWRQNDTLGFGLMPINDLLVTLRENDPRAPLTVQTYYPERRLLADRTLAGKPCRVVRMTPRGGFPETWYFDASTGHLLRREQQAWLPNGPVRTTEYSDFRSVGAVTIPFVVVRREPDGGFVLVTPVEKLTIAVDDAPFVATELKREGDGASQRLAFRLNTGDIVVAGPDHPLRLEHDDSGPRPYLAVRNGLDALIARSLYYELADLALAGGADTPGVWSDGAFFAMATG